MDYLNKEPRTFLESEKGPGAKVREGMIKALAVFGVISLLAIGLWGSVQIVRNIPNAFNSLSAAVVSLTQYFGGNDEENGGVAVVGEEENEEENATSTPSYTSPSGNEAASTSTPSTTTPSRPSYKTPYGTPQVVTVPVTPSFTSDPNGFVDLSVRIIGTGKITNTATNEFLQTTSVSRTDRAAVKFEVTNLGTKVSPVWIFNAKLPTSPAMTYTAPAQQAVYPGQVVEYVIGFDQLVRNSSGIITLTVDPSASIVESSKGNNTASVSITITP